MIGIYKLRNTVNDHFYIGSSINLETRWRDHKKHLRKGIHFNNILQKAWIKYGESCFLFEIIEICTKDSIRTIEQLYIDKFYAHGLLCYNISTVAYAGPGAKAGVLHSASTKKKQSDGLKNNTNSKGAIRSIEFRASLSKHNSGSNNTNAKLTWDIVREIRSTYDETSTYKSFGEKYKVTGWTISRIINNHIWKEA